MNPPQIQCPKCHGSLPAGGFNLADLAPCPHCQRPLRAEIFPAFFRPVGQGQGGEAVMIEGEASCFFHPQKKAVLPCGACGRFICALCDCELNGQHFCPTCLETGRTKGKIKSLENQRTLYDSIAFALAVYPVVIVPLIYFTIFTAPASLFIAIRYWNAPRSIVHPTKLRSVLAILFAGTELLGWVVMFFLIFNRHSHG